MKKIWKYLRHHVQEDFHAAEYGAIACFLALSIAFNYWFDFEDRVLDYLTGASKYLGYFAMYAFSYYGAAAIIALTKGTNVFTRRAFWVRSLVGLAVLSLDGSMPFLRPLLNATVDPTLQYWSYKVVVNGISIVTVLMPLLVFYWKHDRSEGHVYGLRPHAFDARPYFTLLLIMLPVLFVASFQPSFLRQYPMYKTSGAAAYLGVPEYVTALIYEFVYGLDFVTVEFLFRGFFVIGMATVLGRSAVLAMAVTYCYLHFGKPAGEAISSIFGGYILGVVALETRSVWGGVIVHIGIAWSMELLAFVQKMTAPGE